MHPLAQIGAALGCFGVFVTAVFVGVAALIRVSPADPGDLEVHEPPTEE